MKKLIFGITGLTLGGAERVLVDIVNELSQKFEITVFTLYGKGEFEKELSNNVKLVSMVNKSYSELSKIEHFKVSLSLLLNKKKIYKKYIDQNYNTEVAFLEGPITRLFSVKNKKVKKIAWVHNDIGQVFGSSFSAKVKRKLDKKSYSQYNSIVFVSNDNREKFDEIYNIDKNKMVIPNYIDSKRVLEKANTEFDNIFEAGQVNFLTVARLTNQKALDRLIKVHSRLMEEGIKHKFYVIGDGPERKKMKELIGLYSVEKSFILLGKKDNPYPYIKNCDVFALLSYYEGFPMTILESKILNKPILITNTAAREALIGYDKSYIVDNTEQGVYEGIKNSISLLKNMKDEQKINYHENYDIIKQIEKLVE